MATDFQTKEVQNIGTSFSDLTPAYTAGEVTVHAIYISNTSANIVGMYLVLVDGSDTEKAQILYNVEVPPKSTLIVEKPINLTASDTSATQRKLRVKASASASLDAVASVLVIT